MLSPPVAITSWLDRGPRSDFEGEGGFAFLVSLPPPHGGAYEWRGIHCLNGRFRRRVFCRWVRPKKRKCGSGTSAASSGINFFFDWFPFNVGDVCTCAGFPFNVFAVNVLGYGRAPVFDAGIVDLVYP